MIQYNVVKMKVKLTFKPGSKFDSNDTADSDGLLLPAHSDVFAQRLFADRSVSDTKSRLGYMDRRL